MKLPFSLLELAVQINPWDHKLLIMSLIYWCKNYLYHQRQGGSYKTSSKNCLLFNNYLWWKYLSVRNNFVSNGINVIVMLIQKFRDVNITFKYVSHFHFWKLQTSAHTTITFNQNYFDLKLLIPLSEAPVLFKIFIRWMTKIKFVFPTMFSLFLN